MNTKGNKTPMTALKLMRLAGLSTILAGICFIVVGLFHPLNIPTSVTTDTWVNVHIFAVGIGFFGLFGMVGLYARQAEKAGWLGLIGFGMFSIWLAVVMCFSFVEAFILPHLATGFPVFIKDILGMFSGAASETDLGLLPTLWGISGPLYIVGPLLFGIATFRAGVLPRWAGALLAIASMLTPVAAFVPHEYESKVMIPVGLALVCLGYALFAERRDNASETSLNPATVKAELGKVA